MFTGIVQAVGIVRAADPGANGGRDLEIAASFRGLSPGESIAVNGACLTVARRIRGGFRTHAIATTLDRTLLGTLAPGSRVNLERALRAGDPLGGHLVQGHVDGVARVVDRRVRSDTLLLDLAVPRQVARTTVPLGSIAVDGVSLTVNAVPRSGIIQIALIPFTRQHTTLGTLKRGDQVHVEADLIGKYVERLMRPSRARSDRA